jgi:hypothetical protein
MSENNTVDKSSLVRVLRELAELAEHASLTGSLEDGTRRATERYNAILALLLQEGAVPIALFEKMDPTTANYGELGVEAKLLIAFLEGNGSSRRREDEKEEKNLLLRLAPFVKGEDLAELVQDYFSKNTNVDINIVAHLAPFLPSESLGKLLRKSLQFQAKVAEPATTEVPPAPVVSAVPDAPVEDRHAVDEPEATRQMGQSLTDLVQQLRRRDFSEEDRERLAARLDEVARMQAKPF